MAETADRAAAFLAEARTVLARYTFCGYYVSSVKVTSVPGDVTCLACKREFSGRDG